MKLLMLGTWEIIVVVLAILLLFGGKKIPELMHGVGKGVKSFKDGMNGVEEEKTSSHQDVESSRHNDANTENLKS